jgi:hypothetical protein
MAIAKIEGVGQVVLSRYTAMPKGSRSTTHTATVNGKPTTVAVTTGTHMGKQFCYSYLQLDGQVYYTKGHLGNCKVEVKPDEQVKPGSGFEVIK